MNSNRDIPALSGDPVSAAAIDWLLRHEDGSLTEADRQAFEAWLVADPSHSAAYAKAQRLWHDLAAAGEQRGVSSRVRHPRAVVWRIAAAILLAVGIGAAAA